VEISSAISSQKSSFARRWLTAAALLPFLSACSTEGLTGFWFNSNPEQMPASISSSVSSGSMETTKLSNAACGLFLGATDKNASMQTSPVEISLNRSPQENLITAIEFDMAGDYENARKLYVWLTASPPDIKVDLDCGNGITLSGSVNSLAQRRLVGLDTDAPEYARSPEIESVISSATVASGPDLPNPPHVERDRRFYETGGVVIADPEDSTTPVARMNMEFSENTAQLTKVERRASPSTTEASASTPAATTVNSAAAMTAPQIQPTPVIVAKPSPAPSKTPQTRANSLVAPQTPKIITSAPTEPATISGAEETTESTGAVVVSNSRPMEQGELDVIDREPANAMIELPMTSNTQQAKPAAQSAIKKPMAAPKAAPVVNAVSSPYYSIQLAAYRSRERAEGAWPKFQSSSRGVLASASHEVTSIAVEGQGLFFRLLTGQYATKSDASQACNQLKSVGVDCLIRRITP
jgi:hypothetical protein